MVKPLASVTSGLRTDLKRAPHWLLALWVELGGGRRKSGVIGTQPDCRFVGSKSGFICSHIGSWCGLPRSKPSRNQIPREGFNVLSKLEGLVERDNLPKDKLAS